MNKIKIILSALIIVLLTPFVLAQTNMANETQLENETDLIQTNELNETEEQEQTEITEKNENITNETPEENTTCTANAQRTCEIITELGIKEGQEVPFVLPKNGALNMKFFDDTLIGYFEIESGLISKIVCCEEHPDSTHSVKIINMDAVEEIKNAEDFLKEANQKLTKGEITISSTGFMNNVRLSLGKAFIRMSSWFS
jgi:hypothetical protein